MQYVCVCVCVCTCVPALDGPSCDNDEGCDYSCDGSCACDYFPGGDPWATGESCECDQCDEDGESLACPRAYP